MSTYHLNYSSVTSATSADNFLRVSGGSEKTHAAADLNLKRANSRLIGSFIQVICALRQSSSGASREGSPEGNGRKKDLQGKGKDI